MCKNFLKWDWWPPVFSSKYWGVSAVSGCLHFVFIVVAKLRAPIARAREREVHAALWQHRDKVKKVIKCGQNNAIKRWRWLNIPDPVSPNQQFILCAPCHSNYSPRLQASISRYTNLWYRKVWNWWSSSISNHFDNVFAIWVWIHSYIRKWRRSFC